MSPRIASQSKNNGHKIPFTFQHDVKISARNENTFPWRLHIVLDAAEREGFTDIVSWIDQSSFKVHDPEAFVDKIMPRFFQQTKYKSFQRQCNLWGFDRLPSGPQKSGYARKEYFVRGDPALVAQIQRIKIKGPLSKRLGRSKNGGMLQSISTNSLSATIANGKKKSDTGGESVSHQLDDFFAPPTSIPRAIDISIGCRDLEASPEAFNHTKTTIPPAYNEIEVDDIPLNFDDLEVLCLDLLDDDGENGDLVVGGIEDAMLGMDDPSDPCTSIDDFPLLEDSNNEDQEPTLIVYLDSKNSGTRKSSLIDYLVAERRSHRSCLVSTLSTAAVSSSSSSSSSVSSRASLSTIQEGQESHQPLSAICALLRNPCRQVFPTTIVQSCLEHQVVPRKRTPPLSSVFQPLLRETSPANPTKNGDTTVPSCLSSRSYFLSFSSKNLL
jgi:hypothetical protein